MFWRKDCDVIAAIQLHCSGHVFRLRAFHQKLCDELSREAENLVAGDRENRSIVRHATPLATFPWRGRRLRLRCLRNFPVGPRRGSITLWRPLACANIRSAISVAETFAGAPAAIRTRL